MMTGMEEISINKLPNSFPAKHRSDVISEMRIELLDSRGYRERAIIRAHKGHEIS